LPLQTLSDVRFIGEDIEGGSESERDNWVRVRGDRQPLRRLTENVLVKKETFMNPHSRFPKLLTIGLALLALPTIPMIVSAQGARSDAPSSASAPPADDLKALTDVVRQLQSQVQSLRIRVQTLEAKESAAVAESAKLREQLTAANAPVPALGPAKEPITNAAAPAESRALDISSLGTAADNTQPTTDERISRIEEDLAFADSRTKEQSQTKVESSSKYRVRLSGLALFNLFANRGTVDNQDVPQIAKPAGSLDSSGSFGGSLRQSQLGLEAFGPEVAGARTSAEIRFDFAGGFPRAPNGDVTGLVRLRTATVHFDWNNTSIVAGQDYLFFSPLTPTSYASLAIPAMSYSGNLWGWTPQVRIERRFRVSEASSVSVEAGILQTLSGDTPTISYERTATWGEKSGSPGTAARVSWNRAAFGQKIVAAIGGYYGRQNWGFGRSVDSWAGTADLTVPIGRLVEVTGQFYRGRAVGGLGGAIGQSVLWNGAFTDPDTDVYGLDSVGGWAQIKLKPTLKLEMNGAFGEDSPFAATLREFSANPIYVNSLLSRNLTSLVNFIYRPRSDLIFSLEYKHLKTFTLDSKANTANNVNLVVGYIF
jgi:hypothetical protein